MSSQRYRRGGFVALMLAIVLMVLTVACSSDDDDQTSGVPIGDGSVAVPGQSVPPGALSPMDLPLRPVRFNATLPEGTEPPVLIRVFGLHQYETIREAQLERDSDGTWHAIVDVEEGALLRYRYERGESGPVSVSEGRERPHEQLEMVWRLLPVTSDLDEVRDTVAMWTDEVGAVPRGEATGVVMDAATGAPLVDIEIELAGIHTATAFDGSFRLVDVPVGEHRVTAHAIDGRHQAASTMLVVPRDGVGHAELRLEPAQPIEVIFRVALPADTPDWAQVKIGGSVRQLGAWHLVVPNVPESSVMPTMDRAGGTAEMRVTLYEGQYISYRYNLGVFHGNDEYSDSWPQPFRQFVVSEHSRIREDAVETWVPEGWGSVTLVVRVPDNTAPYPVKLQMGPSHWMTQTGDSEFRAFVSGVPGSPQQFRYVLGSGGEVGQDLTRDTTTDADGQRQFTIVEGAQVVEHEVTGWSGLPGSYALRSGQRGEVEFRLSLPPTLADGRSFTLRGAPFDGVLLAPVPGNPSLVIGHAQAVAGQYRVEVEGCPDASSGLTGAGVTFPVQFERQAVDLWGATCGIDEPGARDQDYLRGVYTPDLFSSEYLALTNETYRRIAEYGGNMVALSGVQSYGRILPTPTLEVRPIFAGSVSTPRYALLAQAEAAAAFGLQTLVAPQFNMEMTPEREDLWIDHDREWWDAWLRLAEEHWTYHADIAREIDAALLLLPGPTFHVLHLRESLPGEAYASEFDAALQVLLERSQLRSGVPALFSGGQREYEAPRSADYMGITTYDTGHPNLPSGATLSEWDVAYEALFRERVDPMYAHWELPVFFYTIHVPSVASAGDPHGEYRQALQLEAIFRAIERRPWIAGSMSWAYFMQPSVDGLHDGWRGRLAEVVQAKWFNRFALAEVADR